MLIIRLQSSVTRVKKRKRRGVEEKNGLHEPRGGPFIVFQNSLRSKIVLELPKFLRLALEKCSIEESATSVHLCSYSLKKRTEDRSRISHIGQLFFSYLYSPALCDFIDTHTDRFHRSIGNHCKISRTIPHRVLRVSAIKWVTRKKKRII